MIYPVVRELAADGVPVQAACRVLKVSTSGFYEWDSRPASGRAWDQAQLMQAIRAAHAASHATYGHRRVHAELVLGGRAAGQPRPSRAADAVHRSAGRAPQAAARLHPT